MNQTKISLYIKPKIVKTNEIKHNTQVHITSLPKGNNIFIFEEANVHIKVKDFINFVGYNAIKSSRFCSPGPKHFSPASPSIV